VQFGLPAIESPDICALALEELGAGRTSDPESDLLELASASLDSSEGVMLLLDDGHMLTVGGARRLTDLCRRSRGCLRLAVALDSTKLQAGLVAALGEELVRVDLSQPMSRDEVGQYLTARFGRDGAAAPFGRRIVSSLFQSSGGIPGVLEAQVAQRLGRAAARGVAAPRKRTARKPAPPKPGPRPISLPAAEATKTPAREPAPDRAASPKPVTGTSTAHIGKPADRAARPADRAAEPGARRDPFEGVLGTRARRASGSTGRVRRSLGALGSRATRLVAEVGSEGRERVASLMRLDDGLDRLADLREGVGHATGLDRLPPLRISERLRNALETTSAWLTPEPEPATATAPVPPPAAVVPVARLLTTEAPVTVESRGLLGWLWPKREPEAPKEPVSYFDTPRDERRPRRAPQPRKTFTYPIAAPARYGRQRRR
jgi:hypothetical protein